MEELENLQVINPYAVAPANGMSMDSKRHDSGNAVAANAEARAVSEVKAQVMMARQFPRDPLLSMDCILRECERPTLADAAIYLYPRGNEMISGPSIRLAEVLARNWGNVTFGMEVLERGVAKNGVGFSAIRAFAWDLQTNTYVSRHFEVKHWRSTRSGGYKLTDDRDIYELEANMGSRRLRACILQIIPGDVTSAAVAACRKTSSNGLVEIMKDEKKRADLVAKMLRIRGSKLCIIGARPSVGKSALGLFIATNAARSGKHVLYVSLEMDEAELYDRIIARFSGVPVDVIEARNFSDEQIQSVVAAYAEIGQIQLSISTQAQTPLQIRSLALRQRQDTGLDMIVVDYLQLLRSGRKTNNRAEEVGEISRALKRLAMELKIPVIAMTQMNRQSEMGIGEGGRMPKMSESRESGTIEQDANQFLILHAPDIRTVPEPWQQMAESCQANGWTFMLINVAKNRNGRKGILPIAFDAPHMNFFAFERDTQGG